MPFTNTSIYLLHLELHWKMFIVDPIAKSSSSWSPNDFLFFKSNRVCWLSCLSSISNKCVHVLMSSCPCVSNQNVYFRIFLSFPFFFNFPHSNKKVDNSLPYLYRCMYIYIYYIHGHIGMRIKSIIYDFNVSGNFLQYIYTIDL